MIFTDDWGYVHVPRTAGSVVEYAMERVWRDNSNVKGLYDEQHTTVYDFKGIYNLQKYPSFLFGFVRNPYTYEWSVWKYHSFSWGIFQSFDEWCAYRFDGKKDEVYEKYPSRKDELDYAYILFTRNMAGYFCDENHKCVMNKIYRFEQLKESWDDIGERANTGVQFDMKETKTQDAYKSVYTDYSYNLVKTHRAKDLELFGYDFDGYTGDIPLDFTVDYVGANYAYSRADA
tara:strand:+ start:1629 stop:2321 length:693 start_codon:yes stop_codon:yes gene_type:complete